MEHLKKRLSIFSSKKEWSRKAEEPATNPVNRTPNIEDVVNSLSVPPRSQASHHPQQPTLTDPSIAQDQMQVDVVIPSFPLDLTDPTTSNEMQVDAVTKKPSSVTPQGLMNPTISNAHHQMQVGVSGAEPSFCIPQDLMIASSSTAQEQMQEAIGQVPPRRRRRNWNFTTASIGQDQAFNQVCTFLKDDEVGMVGIYGMGGVGKTTLMKKIRKEYLVPSKFKVILVVVSKTIDIDNIQKDIMEGMNLSFNKYESRHTRAEKINKALAKNKVALLFDDIWVYMDLEELGILGDIDVDPSILKIIFTTRLKKVCNQMQPDEQIKVECLGWDDSWALFERCVTKRTLESNPMIESIAKKVAKECNGLPLAITVIGRAMACKNTPEEWELALTALQKSSLEDPDAEDQLFARLKFSYDTLQDREKECFLYCCLFPEDMNIEVDKLINYWIGEGVLALNGSFMEVSHRGVGIIGTLQAACLLEQVDGDYEGKKMHDVIRDMGLWMVDTKIIKMHDVIRDMGLWIASKSNRNFFIHRGSQLMKSEIDEKWRDAHRIYISEVDGIPGQPLCLNLTTLIYEGQEEIEIFNSFFNSMCKIRVLHLRNVEFRDREVEFGHMLELRYLSIGQSNLSTLPADVGKLRKLVMLDLVYNDRLIEIPENTIRHLVELRKLTFYTKKSSFCTASLMVEVGYLNKLESLWLHEDFKEVDFDFLTPTDTFEQEECGNSLCQLRHSLRCLDMMGGWVVSRSDDMVSAVVQMDKLVNLSLVDIKLPEVLIFPSLCLPSLKTLGISRSQELKKIQVSHLALQNVRELKITDCLNMECIVGLQHLQALVKLTIGGVWLVEVLMEVDDAAAVVCFPSLKYMNLRQLLKLKSICGDDVLFPSLTTFVLEDCLKLRKLPQGLMNEKRTLRECQIYGFKQWWSELMNEKRTLKECRIESSYDRKWWSELMWQDDVFKSFIESTLTPDSRIKLLHGGYLLTREELIQMEDSILNELNLSLMSKSESEGTPDSG